MISILFLAADPADATRLRLGEELREIQEKLQRAKLRKKFELHQRMSIRPSDISQALLDVRPQIVHFSGHGTTAGALCFENQIGETHPVPPDALAALFEQFSRHVNCVVLNACYTEAQANAISEHIDYVIGMDKAIGDKAAIAFAVGFYQALGAGCTITEAYKLGCVQIKLQGIPEHLTPILKKPQGQINFPEDGDVVSRSFRAKGSIDKLPSGSHLYLAVEVEGLVWPKVEVAGTPWSGEVYEGGEPPEGRFDLVLYLIEDEGHRRIMAWLENGKRTGDYPGFRELLGSQRLHGIKLRLKE